MMTLSELQAAIQGVGSQMPQLVAMGMKDAALVMIRDARVKHLSGPKMPRGVDGGFYRSTLAAPTGTLRRSVTSEVDISATGEVRGWVGTNLTNGLYPYPRAHEYGEGKMPERPWLRPSVYTNQEYLQERIVQRILDGYGRQFT